MPILTKASVSKGAPATFTLDTTLLSQLPLVSGSDYADPNDWKAVTMFFKSSTSKQSESITFDLTKPAPHTAMFKVSSFAKGDFQLQQITIYDFDNGFLPIPRSALTVAEFDVAFPSLIWNKGLTITDYGTQSGLQTSSTGTFSNGSISNAINGDFDVTFEIEMHTLSSDFMAGFALSQLDLSGGINSFNNAHMIYASYGTVQSAGEWGLGMETNPTGNFGAGVGIYKVNFKRIGSTITYALTDKNNTIFSQGNAKTNHSGAVYFIFQPFNYNLRLNSITLT